MIPHNPTLENFGLIWRFSDAGKYTQLSDSEFLRFHPLSEAEALKQWEQSVYPDSSPGHRHLVELRVRGLVQWPQTVSFRSESKNEEQEVVRNLQREITASDSSEVIFFWHAQQAVKTDWLLFLDHWDDFCYPGDDSNILLVPEAEKAAVYIEERWYILNLRASGPVFTRPEMSK